MRFTVGDLLPAHYEAGLSEKVQEQPISISEFWEFLQNNNKLMSVVFDQAHTFSVFTCQVS